MPTAPAPGAPNRINLIGFLFLYAVLRLQDILPLNPQGFAAVSADSSFNTAVSFATNTNWQAYAGETTLSHFTQVLALTVQNFVSAATGMAVLVALVRGLTRRSTTGLGSFWVDLTRSTLVLVPLSLLLALALVSQGVVQTFDAAVTASQVAIKPRACTAARCACSARSSGCSTARPASTLPKR